MIIGRGQGDLFDYCTQRAPVLFTVLSNLGVLPSPLEALSPQPLPFHFQVSRVWVLHSVQPKYIQARAQQSSIPSVLGFCRPLTLKSYTTLGVKSTYLKNSQGWLHAILEGKAVCCGDSESGHGGGSLLRLAGWRGQGPADPKVPLRGPPEGAVQQQVGS